VQPRENFLYWIKGLSVAFITAFQVDGLAGRKDSVHYELDRHVNIFWGLNGSGKTSLLKILHSGMSGDASSLLRLPFQSAVIRILDDTEKSVVRTISKQAILESLGQSGLTFGDLSHMDYEERNWLLHSGPRPRWTSKDSRGRRVREELSYDHCYLPISRVADRYSLRRSAARPAPREAVDEAWFDAVFADQVRSRWQTYNARALAKIRAVQQQGIAEILSVLFGGATPAGYVTEGKLSNPESAYALVTGFLERQNIKVNFDTNSFTKRYISDEGIREIVQRIRRVTDEITQALRPQEDFSKLINELYSGGKTLQIEAGTLEISAGGSGIALESLSSGEKQLLQILLEALAGEGASVIVDEPELSMHVDWQRRLVAAMRTVSPDCQLILATHSPEVMADVRDSEVFEL
jgi:predicted ATPase